MNSLFLTLPKVEMGSPFSSQKWVSFHFLLLLLLFLLPDQIRSGSIVKYLPGYSGELPFKLETGYISVGDSELFYYFIESQFNPSLDPLFLWLTGGPACSSFSGLIYENGPIIFDTENYKGGLPEILDYPYAWTNNGSFLYLDAPVGNGFSYSATQQGWSTSDSLSAEQSYQFIVKWLEEHQQFLQVELFVAGDSYSGIIIPQIVKKIVDANEDGVLPHLNIRGYLAGSPRTDYVLEQNSRVVFAHRMMLIPDELYESAKNSCNANYVNIDPSNTPCLRDIEAINVCTKNLNQNSILEPTCTWSSTNPNSEHRERSLEEHRIDQFLQLRKGPKLPSPSCWQDFGFNLAIIWANDERVQDALYIRKGTVLGWKRCNYTLQELYKSDVLSVIDIHRYLSTKEQLRVLIQNGDHDMVVPVEETTTWLKALNLYIQENWRPWFIDGQVIGYTRMFSRGSYSTYRLTFASVKGAGHTAPEFKRKECYEMFRRWVNYYPL